MLLAVANCIHSSHQHGNCSITRTGYHFAKAIESGILMNSLTSGSGQQEFCKSGRRGAHQP